MLIIDMYSEKMLMERENSSSDLQTRFGAALLQISIRQFETAAQAADQKGDYVKCKWLREQRDMAISALIERKRQGEETMKRCLFYRLKKWLIR